MDSSVWALLLLVLGIVFLMAEVFIPSGGIISLLSGLCLLAGIYQGWTAWSKSQPIFFVVYLIGMLLLIPSGVAVALYLWPHTKLGKEALLTGPSPDEVDAFSEIEREHNELIGHTGVTVSILNPAGLARIDGKRVVCQSEGSIVEIGTPIRVVAARTNLVIVRPYTPTAADASAPVAEPKVTEAATAVESEAAPQINTAKPDPEKIDFDMT